MADMAINTDSDQTAPREQSDLSPYLSPNQQP